MGSQGKAGSHLFSIDSNSIQAEGAKKTLVLWAFQLIENKKSQTMAPYKPPILKAQCS